MTTAAIAGEALTKPAHAKYSPSTFGYRAICAGWTRREDSDSTAAAEGTFLHNCCENETVTGCTPEQERLVQSCLSYSAKLRSRGTIFKELRVQILGGRTYGSADLVIVHGTRADLIDYKFGNNPVDDAEVNLQGIAYTVGIFERFTDVELVFVHFLLPRRGEVTRACFRRSDLPALKLKITVILDRVEEYERTKNETLLHPSEKSCTYCGRIGSCPAVFQYALPYSAAYEGLPLIANTHTSQITELPEATRTYRAILVLEKMVESAKKHITELARQNGGLFDETGERVFRIAERKGNRKVRDVSKFWETIRTHLSAEEVVAESTISVAGCLDRVREKLPRGKKGELLAELETALHEQGAVEDGPPISYLAKERAAPKALDV